MKKALQITLAGSLFTIEEDAYEKLHHYLQSIKDYFRKLHDTDDVIEDIEARIAEQLLESMKTHNNIVTISDVTTVIASMGTIEEISGESQSDKKEDEPKAERKLFRDADNAVVGGVASGFAVYFDMDPLIMRCIFIFLTIITSGGFIFAYIALAIFVPKAITEADKLKMRGGPVTLSSFKETFSEHVNNVKNASSKVTSHASPVRKFLERLFAVVGTLVRIFGKIFIKTAGLFLTIVPILASIALIFGLINLLADPSGSFINFPFNEVIPTSMYYIMVVIGFLIAFIPILLTGALGASLLFLKQKMSGLIALGLFGLWIVALMLAGTFAIQYGPRVRSNIERIEPQLRHNHRFFDDSDYDRYHQQTKLIVPADPLMVPTTSDTN